MDTKDVGSLFVATGRREKRSAIFFRSPAYELDPPYRYAVGVGFRVGRWGFLVGWWGKSPAKSPAHHYLMAIDGASRAHPEWFTEEVLNKLEPTSGPDSSRWIL